MISGALLKFMKNRGIEVKVEPTLQDGYRPDLIIRSPSDSTTYIVEIKKNVFTDDVARMASVANEQPDSKVAIISVSKVPEHVKTFAEAQGVTLLKDLRPLASELDNARGGVSAHGG